MVQAEGIGPQISNQQRNPLALPLGFGMLLELLALRRKPDAIQGTANRPFTARHSCKNVRVFDKLQGWRLALRQLLLLDFLTGSPVRSPIRHCRICYKNTSFRRTKYNGFKHILCRFDIHPTDSPRRRKADRSCHQRNLGAGLLGGAGNCKTHLATRQIGDATYRVDRLVSGTGRDQHMLASKPFRRKKRDDVFQQLLGFQHPAIASFTTSLEAMADSQNRRAVQGELRQIALCDGVRIHLAVHGRRHQQRDFVHRPGQAHQAEQVVRTTVQKFGHKVCAAWCDHYRVGLTRQVDMCHAVGLAHIPLAGIDWPAAQRLHGDGRDELLCSCGHHDLDGGSGFHHRAAQFCRFVAGNTPGKTQHNVFSGQFKRSARVHAVFQIM